MPRGSRGRGSVSNLCTHSLAHMRSHTHRQTRRHDQRAQVTPSSQVWLLLFMLLVGISPASAGACTNAPNLCLTFNLTCLAKTIFLAPSPVQSASTQARPPGPARTHTHTHTHTHTRAHNYSLSLSLTHTHTRTHTHAHVGSFGSISSHVCPPALREVLPQRRSLGSTLSAFESRTELKSAIDDHLECEKPRGGVSVSIQYWFELVLHVCARLCRE